MTSSWWPSGATTTCSNVGTWKGRVPVLIGQWVVKRGDSIEVSQEKPKAGAGSR
jgi:hypothetical protein